MVREYVPRSEIILNNECAIDVWRNETNVVCVKY